MKNVKHLLLALLLLLGAVAAFEITPAAQATPSECAAVTCLVCPEGTIAVPKPGDCCRCVPVKR